MEQENKQENVTDLFRHVAQGFFQRLVNAALERALGAEEGKRVHVEAYVSASEDRKKDKPTARIIPQKRVASKDETTGKVEYVFTGPGAVQAFGWDPASMLESCYLGAVKAFRYFGKGKRTGKPTDLEVKTIRELPVPVPENWAEAAETLIRAGANRKKRPPLVEMQLTLSDGEETEEIHPRVVSGVADRWEAMLEKLASHFDECELAQEQGLSFAFLDMESVKEQELVRTAAEQVKRIEESIKKMEQQAREILVNADLAKARIAERKAKRESRGKEVASKVATA